MLDPRTLPNMRKLGITDEQRRCFWELLRDAHLAFAKTAEEYKAAKFRKAAEKRAQELQCKTEQQQSVSVSLTGVGILLSVAMRASKSKTTDDFWWVVQLVREVQK